MCNTRPTDKGGDIVDKKVLVVDDKPYFDGYDELAEADNAINQGTDELEKADEALDIDRSED